MSLQTLASFGTVLLFLTGALSASHAQPLVEGPFLEVHAGLNAPPSETKYQDPGLTKDYGVGWGMDVAAGLPLNERVDGALRISYSQFGGVALDRSFVPPGEAAPVTFRADGGALRIGSMRFALRAALRESGRFIPYLRVAPTLFILSRETLQRTATGDTPAVQDLDGERTINFGVGAAAGLAIQVMPGARVLVEPGIVHSFTSVVVGARNQGLSWIPLRIGALVTL
jgi:hypothetical protein